MAHTGVLRVEETKQTPLALALKGDRAILRGALLGLTIVFPRGFSRPTGDSRYGDSVGGPALGLSASPVLNLNIFFAPGLHNKPYNTTSQHNGGHDNTIDTGLPVTAGSMCRLLAEQRNHVQHMPAW